MRKLINYIIISTMFALLGTYILNIYSKDKFTSKIKISALHPSESVLLHLINMKLKSNRNAMDDVVGFFSSKLNDKIYNTQNACKEINKLNNIVPFIISYSQTEINIEMTSYDQNSIIKCKEFIIKEMKNENKRIVKFYKTILESSSLAKGYGLSSRKDLKFNFKELKEQYTSLQQEILDIANNEETMSQSQVQQMLYLYQLLAILYEDLASTDTSIEYDLTDKLEYFKINLNKNTVDKKLNIYFLFISFFISIFFTLVIFNKFKNKKSLIIKKIDKFLS